MQQSNERFAGILQVVHFQAFRSEDTEGHLYGTRVAIGMIPYR